MPSKFFATFLLLAFLRLISSETFEQDVSDLQELLELVVQSNLTLRGWARNIDPCGEALPCGITGGVECPWEGIACVLDEERQHRVVGIEIKGHSSSQQLSGFLPRRLPLALESLSLPNNRLKGSLSDPDCDESGASQCSDVWARNTQLTTIDLDGNQLEGSLPNWVELENLDTINLARNGLSGPLPYRWKEKIHLTTIDLSYNFLIGSLPVEWSQLFVLKTLILSNNLFVNEIPYSWFLMPKLAVLDVAGNCALCGQVESREGLTIYGDDTNLKTECSECDGCECHPGTLQFVVTNVLLSLSVLVLSLLAWLLRKWCKRNDTDQLPIRQPTPIVVKPFEPPTIVVSPGDEVFFAKVLEEGPFSSSSSESLSSKSLSSSESSADDNSDDDSSEEWQSDSDSDSVDSKVLAFMGNSFPIPTTPVYRTNSTGHAGVCETIHENCNSEINSGKEIVGNKHRRSKSALQDVSFRSLASNEENSVTQPGPSCSSALQPNDVSIPQVDVKKSKKKLRSFKRKNRRGMAGDFRISEPQRSLGLPEDFNTTFSVTQPSESKAVQTSESFTNKE